VTFTKDIISELFSIIDTGSAGSPEQICLEVLKLFYTGHLKNFDLSLSFLIVF
jgi:hypothetical protein